MPSPTAAAATTAVVEAQIAGVGQAIAQIGDDAGFELMLDMRE